MSKRRELGELAFMKLFGIAPLAVEGGDFGQDRTWVVLDTAAKHGTEKSRVGAEARPGGVFPRRHRRSPFGRERRMKGRNFNGSLQRVPLRRTGRPVVGRSGRGLGRARSG